MQALVLCLSLLVGAVAEPGPELHSERPDEVPRVRELRLRGSLDSARSLAERELAQPGLEPLREIALRLEVARIHDRFGLHRNTRPVAAALEQIERAEALAESSGEPARAAVELALADYHYRAEAAGREFPVATKHAHRAIELFSRLGDHRGQAEAVHKLGLIFMQRGELDRARELFDQSLALERVAGETAFFRGEYERHVALIHLRRGETGSAIPHLERSLAARREAGALDASLFAAATLASALVRVGRLEDARAPLLYAFAVAQRVDSARGKATVSLTLGRLYAGEGDRTAARIAFESALRIAESIRLGSMAEAARAGLDEL